MQSERHVKTTSLPGNRIEITAPGLPEGLAVDITLHYDSRPPKAGGVLALLDQLPPGPRSAASWEELEQRVQAEREAWGLARSVVN
ncbi:MAG: hypothetical protein GC168_19055 [Candidatus Hydrogenedens sp.]|nr:hypothetical protein [Candidatus Hydrogenedens sp.]